MITVQLNGGLGNQLFQLAFLEYLKKYLNVKIFLKNFNSPSTIHSKSNYFDNIFINFKDLYDPSNIDCFLYEKSLFFEDWSSRIDKNKITEIRGYFQDHKYTDLIFNDFLNKLNFDKKCIIKYPYIKESIFIHIRGGDYLTSGLHHVDLTNYYKRCINMCKNENFIIFTNDVNYANKLLSKIECKYSILILHELDTLYLMSQCKGGICANSSFSWWGAYLNTNRKLFLPSKWYNDRSMNTSGYYFNGCTIIDV